MGFYDRQEIKMFIVDMIPLVVFVVIYAVTYLVLCKRPGTE